MLFIFSNLTFAKVGKTVMLVVLTEVEANPFALDAHAHRNALVDEPIAEVAHAEGVDKDYRNGKDMKKKYDNALSGSRDESILNEDARHDGSHDTTRSMGREHVESIVNTVIGVPVNGDVTDDGDDESNEHGLSDGDV